MKNTLPARVKIVEVGPRDGLQNEPPFIPTEVKIAFIDMLSAAGLSHIEVSSFVSPSWVPQLGDATEVFAGINQSTTTVYSALVPNVKGLQRAIDAGVRHIAVFAAASEAFSKKNINATIDESFQRMEPVVREASAAGISVRGYVSTAFGCPYDGPVAKEKVAEVAGRLYRLGITEVALGDTNGIALPDQVPEVLRLVCEEMPVDSVAVHFHDTCSRALANVTAALQFGVTTVDSSAGGLGGCPYAPGASGNLATEDLLDLLHGMGIETGVDFDKVVEASRFMEASLGRKLSSRVLATLPDKSERCH